MQKIKLLIGERIGLQGILNETYAKGGLDLSGLLMAQKIVGFLVMTPADQKAVDWVVDEKNNLIKWNTAKDKGREVELAEDEMKFLKEMFKRKDEAKGFGTSDAALISLAEKIGYIDKEKK